MQGQIARLREREGTEGPALPGHTLVGNFHFLRELCYRRDAAVEAQRSALEIETNGTPTDSSLAGKPTQ